MNEPSIYVPRDFEGIRLAALELFEDSLIQQQADRALDRAEGTTNRERLAASFRSKRTMAGGYYAWVEYLLDLESILESGVHLPIENLKESEIKGMRMVRLARGEFSRKYSACGQCGELNHRFALQCGTCGASFRKAKAA